MPHRTRRGTRARAGTVIAWPWPASARSDSRGRGDWTWASRPSPVRIAVTARSRSPRSRQARPRKVACSSADRGYGGAPPAGLGGHGGDGAAEYLDRLGQQPPAARRGPLGQHDQALPRLGRELVWRQVVGPATQALRHARREAETRSVSAPRRRDVRVPQRNGRQRRARGTLHLPGGTSAGRSNPIGRHRQDTAPAASYGYMKRARYLPQSRARSSSKWRARRNAESVRT